MIFKRKIYDRLLEWKREDADRYAVLLEGARRVGKTTIVKEFAKNEYKSCIVIDFSKRQRDILACFDDLYDLDTFFLRLQTVAKTQLYEHDSVIVFDEVQLFPPAREAIKHLLADGRYHYIETGSLLSIKRNVQNILIPSEEIRMAVHPMDYEEFCMATGTDYEVLRKAYLAKVPMGQNVCRSMMRHFRLYMAVGGMPQAVEAYVDKRSFREIDAIKRRIIQLYEDDFRKIDPSGRVSDVFKSVPSHLSHNTRRFFLSRSTKRKDAENAQNALYDLIDSKVVLPCYNTSSPSVDLASSKVPEDFKLYVGDTGLFVTLLFLNRPFAENDLYAKLLSDKLPANLGYLYENVAAQIITASGRDLYFHTWRKENSTHSYEIDFLISQGAKVDALEVKSSDVGKHASIEAFATKFSRYVGDCFVISQKDVAKKESLRFLPICFLPFLVDRQDC